MKRMTLVVVAIVLCASVTYILWERPVRSLARLGFPDLPHGSQVQNSYKLGGFSVVYMMRARIPVDAVEAYARSFRWSRQRIGDQQGDVQVLVMDRPEDYKRAWERGVLFVFREPYPQTYGWWDPQTISQGLLFSYDEGANRRRAYINVLTGTVYLIYEHS